jgi:hypothetical protein
MSIIERVEIHVFTFSLDNLGLAGHLAAGVNRRTDAADALRRAYPMQ